MHERPDAGVDVGRAAAAGPTSAGRASTGLVEAGPVLRGPTVAGRAYYAAELGAFLAHDEDAVLGEVVRGAQGAVEPEQRDAWVEQIRLLRRELSGAISDAARDALVAFEFVVPRVGKRIDVLLLIGGAVFVVEFKVGDKKFTAAAIEQVWDYALDLKNFHSTSHSVRVVPVLVATEATALGIGELNVDADGLLRPVCIAPSELSTLIERVLGMAGAERIDAADWARGRYTPTPTIVEAAMALYGKHGVEDISRSDAGAINLTRTSVAIEQIIQHSRAEGRKSICFVTGVPGAGKTLVGLNIATKHFDKQSELYSVFLSGNGPLVRVLCEALARDKAKREKSSVKRARSEVSAFVQNVHHFRDDGLKDPGAPVEHVALFDEAQRAWNRKKTADFMARRKKRPGFDMSEPEFLISCMDRHQDWAVIVCLVGGGQEINTGEAGIGEWVQALVEKYPDWHVHLSPRLEDTEYGAGEPLRMLAGRRSVHEDECLHLGVSMRSFRAEHVSGLVKQLLDLDQREASRLLAELKHRYPIVLTRDLDRARRWVREKARGSERYGMMVSSQAQRLKPLAIDVRVDIEPVHWFLHGRDDVRSSYYLEDAATEFHVQGLELDWGCVVWDADLRHTGAQWEHWSFKGKRWQHVKKDERQAYLKNAYRVLLTRARQGMAIVVPRGDANDATRHPEWYDGTWAYLRGLGIAELGD